MGLQKYWPVGVICFLIWLYLISIHDNRVKDCSQYILQRQMTRENANPTVLVLHFMDTEACDEYHNFRDVRKLLFDNLGWHTIEIMRTFQSTDYDEARAQIVLAYHRKWLLKRIGQATRDFDRCILLFWCNHNKV